MLSWHGGFPPAFPCTFTAQDTVLSLLTWPTIPSCSRLYWFCLGQHIKLVFVIETDGFTSQWVLSQNKHCSDIGEWRKIDHLHQTMRSEEPLARQCHPWMKVLFGGAYTHLQYSAEHIPEHGWCEVTEYMLKKLKWQMRICPTMPMLQHKSVRQGYLWAVLVSVMKF